MLQAWQLQGQKHVVHLGDRTRELSVDCLCDTYIGAFGDTAQQQPFMRVKGKHRFMCVSPFAVDARSDANRLSSA